MGIQKMPRLILLFGLLLVPFILSGCTIEGCDCEDEIAATYDHFGQPEEISSTGENNKFTTTLCYIALGFKKTFTWGDEEDLCCNEVTNTITGNDCRNDTGENNPPMAINQEVYPQLNEPKKIELSANDPDGDSLTYRITTEPDKGQLDPRLNSNDGVFTYTPDGDAMDKDTDEFTFVVNDGKVDSTDATVKITLGNQVPKAEDVQVTRTVNSGHKVTIQLKGSDRNGDTLTYELVDTSGVTRGTLKASELNRVTGTIPYVQGAGAYEEKFTYKVTDSEGEESTDTGTVTITVREPKAAA